jgi:hypothetical protein
VTAGKCYEHPEKGKKLMSLEKNQPNEETVEPRTSISPKDAEPGNAELTKDEAEQVAGGFMVNFE